MRLIIYLILLSFYCNEAFAQVIYPYRTCNSPKELVEFSGIAKIDKNVLVGVNDGGNKPCLYFMDTTGKLIRKRVFTTIQNVDWEEVFYENGIIHICDIGDNGSTRKETRIYLYDLKKDTIVSAKRIMINEKSKQPLSKSKLNYDCEAAFYFDKKIWLFSKTHASPYKGISYQYVFSAIDKTVNISATDSISFGTTGFIQNSITGAAISPKNHIAAFISCTRLWLKFDFLNQVSFYNQLGMDFEFDGLTQKEAITFLSDYTFVVADERTAKIMGGRMYFFDLKPYLTGSKKYAKPVVKSVSLKRSSLVNFFELNLELVQKQKKISVLFFDKGLNLIYKTEVEGALKSKQKIGSALKSDAELESAKIFWLVSNNQVIYTGKIN